MAFLAATVWFVRRRPASSPSPPPRVADPERSVPGFGGELALADGGRLAVWLAPMHGDPARQAFETRALRRRLGLREGEPWRLVVSSLGERTPEGADSSPSRVSIALGPVEVHDAAGLALASLSPEPHGTRPESTALEAPDAMKSAPSDPLRTLLAPPTGELHAGHAAHWILWGRAPQGEPVLTGLEGDPGAGSLALRPRELRGGDLHLPVARLDRDDEASGLQAAARSGKTSSEEPSEDLVGRPGNERR